jgi:hypothetical protein
MQGKGHISSNPTGKKYRHFFSKLMYVHESFFHGCVNSHPSGKMLSGKLVLVNLYICRCGYAVHAKDMPDFDAKITAENLKRGKNDFLK